MFMFMFAELLLLLRCAAQGAAEAAADAVAVRLSRLSTCGRLFLWLAALFECDEEDEDPPRRKDPELKSETSSAMRDFVDDPPEDEGRPAELALLVLVLALVEPDMCCATMAFVAMRCGLGTCMSGWFSGAWLEKDEGGGGRKCCCDCWYSYWSVHSGEVGMELDEDDEHNSGLDLDLSTLFALCEEVLT